MSMSGMAVALTLAALAPRAPAPPARPARTAEAERWLARAFGKGSKEVARARFKFVVRDNKGDDFFVFAADRLTFEKDGCVRVVPCRFASFLRGGGKVERGFRMTGDEVRLRFDRPVRRAADFPRARVRTIELTGHVVMW